MGWCPEDQHAKVFFNAVELMLDLRRHEHKTAGLDRPIFTGHSNRGAAADHVINLVLEVRPLAIGRCLRPHRQANAQPVGGKEIDVAVTFGIASLWIQLRDLVRFHRHL